jgi:hypothetical protein
MAFVVSDELTGIAVQVRRHAPVFLEGDSAKLEFFPGIAAQNLDGGGMIP